MPLREEVRDEPMRLRLLPIAAVKGDPARLVVHEVYASVQGESTYAGLPCVFVRTTGCHLRCVYCDTEHAFHEGTIRTVDDLVRDVRALGPRLVEVTGGEPLLQRGAFELMTRLCDLDFRVLVETSGAVSIRDVDPRVVRIVDVKTPGSGEVEANVWANLASLRPSDEVKLVLCSRADYDWMREVLSREALADRCTVLVGVAFGELDPRELVAWILEDRLPVRFQLQQHKHVWPPDTRGV